MVQFRLDKAKEFGADDVIDVSKNNLIEALKELTNGEMADVVVVGPNSADAMRQGIESAGAGGRVLFLVLQAFVWAPCRVLPFVRGGREG